VTRICGYNLVMIILALILRWIAYACAFVSFVLAGALMLRMLLQWMQVNPFGWVALNLRRLTEPIMRPFSYGLDGRMMRFDMMPIVAAALVLINGLFASSLLHQASVVLDVVGHAPQITLGLVAGALVWFALLGYMALLFVRFLLPMLGVGYSNGLIRFAYKLTEPVLRPLRRFLIFGNFDLSPLALIFVIQFLGGPLAGWLMRL
jgi:uncharacterized protein YggT (Ycf19 family)